MSSILSILGLYQYDNSIFDEMAIPSNVDKTILINNILMECAENEILYTNPDFLKQAIKAWSLKEKITWDSLAETFDLEYNPLWNVDAVEYTKETKNLYGNFKNIENRNITNDSTSKSENKEVGEISLSKDVDETVNETVNETIKHSVVGFNSTTKQLANEDATNRTTNRTTDIAESNSENREITDNANSTSKNIESGSVTDTNNYEDKGDTIIEHNRHGNIGVTMSQQLLEAELAVRPKLNIYNYIIDSFKNRFCLMIY